MHHALKVASNTFLVASLAVLGGCSGSNVASSSEGTVPSGDVPCDVAATLGAHCSTCHGATPQFGAPMSLVTYADLMAAGKSDPSRKNAELIAARVHDERRPMPPAPNARLAANESATLDAWVRAGAPPRAASAATCPGASSSGSSGNAGSSGNTGSSGAPGSSGSSGGPGGQVSCTTDVHLVPPSPWAMPQNRSDQYVCYGIDVPVSAKRHIVALAPRIDNARILHHIVVTQNDVAYPSTPQACSSASVFAGGRVIYAWAPGGRAFELPPQAGLPMEGTNHYMVQIHYNNVQGLAGQTDATGVDLCTTDQLRPNDADVVAFGSTSFAIPARGTLDLGCDYAVPASLDGTTMFRAMPHMHQLGASIGTTQVGADGATHDMGTNAAWSFWDQPFFAIDAKLRAGDTVHTRCVWKNGTDAPVRFGENTEDEMCWSFTMYYPRVKTTSWQWAGPSRSAKCVAK